MTSRPGCRERFLGALIVMMLSTISCSDKAVLEYSIPEWDDLPLPSVTVNGVAYKSDGTPAAHAEMTLRQLTPQMRAWTGGGADQDGRFSIHLGSEVESGRYALAGKIPSGVEVGVDTVEVTTESVHHDLHLSRPGRLHGHASLSGQGDHFGIAVRAEVLPYGDVTDSAGAWELWLPPGRWLVTFSKLGYAAVTTTADLDSAGADVRVPDVTLAPATISLRNDARTTR
ncbi:MAG TPA: carboxypeptidase-like regulatory domain-containing protein [Candidatus Eisenbacteria bacterium]|nr:carboxypeptidase-like regulatory domain-containing protein [Candidatus Eisenbacteria bacterium]